MGQNNCMDIVRFTHHDYGEMETTSQHWIEYYIFDAMDKDGNVYPVHKDDCSSPYVETP